MEQFILPCVRHMSMYTPRYEHVHPRSIPSRLDSRRRDLSTQSRPFRAVATPEPTGRIATLIVNARARRGAERFAQARECLEASGVRIEAARALEVPEHLPDVLGASIDSGATLVVIGGGDGSLRCVAGILAETNTVLGVLPLGTVNDFARNLGIEPNIEVA